MGKSKRATIDIDNATELMICMANRSHMCPMNSDSAYEKIIFELC